MNRRISWIRSGQLDQISFRIDPQDQCQINIKRKTKGKLEESQKGKLKESQKKTKGKLKES